MASAVCRGNSDLPGSGGLPLDTAAGAQRACATALHCCAQRRSSAPVAACSLAGATTTALPRTTQESKVWRAERHDVAEQLHCKGVSRRDGLHCGIAWARTEPAQLNNVVHASGCLPSADPHPAPPSRVHHGCAVLLAPPASHQPCLELLQLCCAPALARRPAPLLLLACCMAALPHRPRPAGRRTTQPPNLLPRPCRLPTHVRPPNPPTSQFYGHKLAQSELSPSSWDPMPPSSSACS